MSDETENETESAADEQRRKFKEALERKKSQSHATAAGHDESKGPAPHGAATQKRMFRRKSGG